MADRDVYPFRQLINRRDVLVSALTWAVSVAMLLAVPVVVVAAEQQELGPSDMGSRWWVLVAVTAQCLAVAGARSRPVAAVVAATAIPVLLVWPGHGVLFGLVSAPVLVVVYRAGVNASVQRLRLPLMAAVALVAIAHAGNEQLTGGGPGLGPIAVAALFQALVVISAPLLMGLLIAARRDARTAESRRLKAMASEHEARVQAVIAEQRTAMARELHDIAAHHLSGLTLMASAVDRQIDSDPAAAKESVAQMRVQSTQVLDDLRRLVGLLRDGAGQDVSATLQAVPDLVGEFAARGEPVRLQTLNRTTGAPLGGGLGPAAQVSAYRMVQESLANAQQHASGAATTVHIDDRSPDQVVVTVDNEPGNRTRPAGAGGFGLRGMTERADLIAASLSYGPLPEGGWQVRLAIPRAHPQRACSDASGLPSLQEPPQ